MCIETKIMHSSLGADAVIFLHQASLCDALRVLYVLMWYLKSKLTTPFSNDRPDSGNVVLEIPRSAFEEEIDDVKYEKSVYEDSDLTTDDLKEVVARFKSVYEKANLSFPQDAYEQLSLAIGAVFGGWMGARAVKYREVENIRNLLGTAVNVQAMVVSPFARRVRRVFPRVRVHRR